LFSSPSPFYRTDSATETSKPSFVVEKLRTKASKVQKILIKVPTEEFSINFPNYENFNSLFLLRHNFLNFPFEFPFFDCVE
jgi:hypothetical protein